MWQTLFHAGFPACSVRKTLIRGSVPTVPLFQVLVVFGSAVYAFVHRAQPSLEHVEHRLPLTPQLGTDREHPAEQWELTQHTSLRYRHSSRDPWRSR